MDTNPPTRHDASHEGNHAPPPPTSQPTAAMGTAAANSAASGPRRLSSGRPSARIVVGGGRASDWSTPASRALAARGSDRAPWEPSETKRSMDGSTSYRSKRARGWGNTTANRASRADDGVARGEARRHLLDVRLPSPRRRGPRAASASGRDCAPPPRVVGGRRGAGARAAERAARASARSASGARAARCSRGTPRRRTRGARVRRRPSPPASCASSCAIAPPVPGPRCASARVACE